MPHITGILILQRGKRGDRTEELNQTSIGEILSTQEAGYSKSTMVGQNIRASQKRKPTTGQPRVKVKKNAYLESRRKFRAIPTILYPDIKILELRKEV